MKSHPRMIAAFAAVCLLSVAAFAADPTGTWKWSAPGRSGGTPREQSLSLALKDGTLTGALAGRQGETPISNASIKDDTVSFTVEREFNGTKVVSKYTGKIAGDTIKGSIDGADRDGKVSKREWEAKRAK